MAKISLDTDQLDTLNTIRADLSKLEAEYEEGSKQLEGITELKKKVAEIGETLNKKRKEWDDAIADIPEQFKTLLEKSASAIARVRGQVSPKTPAKTGVGKAETIKWLKKTLADGAMTEEELRKAGEGKKLRLKSYVEDGTIIEENGKSSLPE